MWRALEGVEEDGDAVDSGKEHGNAGNAGGGDEGVAQGDACSSTDVLGAASSAAGGGGGGGGRGEQAHAPASGSGNGNGNGNGGDAGDGALRADQTGEVDALTGEA